MHKDRRACDILPLGCWVLPDNWIRQQRGQRLQQVESETVSWARLVCRLSTFQRSQIISRLDPCTFSPIVIF